jgi:hypothetical protein
VANRFLVALGGNDGRVTLQDSWALDTSEKPYSWRKISDSGETPPPRYGYSPLVYLLLFNLHSFILQRRQRDGRFSVVFGVI